MAQGGQVIPHQLYEELEELIMQRFGEEWSSDKKENRRFLSTMTSVIESSGEMHLIERPECTDGRYDFDLWVEYPVADVWDTDELAFSIFSQIADDIFLSTRQVEERGVRYRFITGSMNSGHRGSLHLTGPNAMDLVNLYRMKITQGERYHA
ncbi:MAG TPA: hypothetical protein VNZ58_10965 [Thermomicrobiales bacterium]|nr:hypothetical protein [Thermomicrobiales bacterium]